jgi:hypothetical protein
MWLGEAAELNGEGDDQLGEPIRISTMRNSEHSTREPRRGKRSVTLAPLHSLAHVRKRELWVIRRILRGVDIVVRVLKRAFDAVSASQLCHTGHTGRKWIGSWYGFDPMCGGNEFHSRKGRLVARLAEAGVVGAGVLALSPNRRDGNWFDQQFSTERSHNVTVNPSPCEPEPEPYSRYFFTSLSMNSVKSGST